MAEIQGSFRPESLNKGFCLFCLFYLISFGFTLQFCESTKTLPMKVYFPRDQEVMFQCLAWNLLITVKWDDI